MLSPVLSLTPYNLTTALLDKGGLLSLFESIQTPESKKPAVKLVSLNMVPGLGIEPRTRGFSKLVSNLVVSYAVLLGAIRHPRS